jgi:uncharacterized membrane protein YdbT with pleckstrin-like domain
MDTEKTICEVKPSQIKNLKPFFISFIGIAIIITASLLAQLNYILWLLIIPLAYALWKFLEVDTMKLKLTDQRLILCEGVLNKRTNETELYRVRDSIIEEPLLYRMFGLGNVIVFTTDDAQSTLNLKAYKNPHLLKDHIRNNSEICRQKKRWGTDNILLHDQFS